MSYAIQSDIEAVFGPAAVAAWTFYVEPGGTVAAADPTRVAAALAYADAEVDGAFAGGPYAVPLQATAAAAPTVAQWAAVIAGCYLYGSRATVSYVDYAGGRFVALRAAVYADMHKYRAGVKRLAAALRVPQPSSPGGV